MRYAYAALVLGSLMLKKDPSENPPLHGKITEKCQDGPCLDGSKLLQFHNTFHLPSGFRWFSKSRWGFHFAGTAVLLLYLAVEMWTSFSMAAWQDKPEETAMHLEAEPEPELESETETETEPELQPQREPERETRRPRRSESICICANELTIDVERNLPAVHRNVGRPRERPEVANKWLYRDKVPESYELPYKTYRHFPDTCQETGDWRHVEFSYPEYNRNRSSMQRFKVVQKPPSSSSSGSFYLPHLKHLHLRSRAQDLAKEPPARQLPYTKSDSSTVPESKSSDSHSESDDSHLKDRRGKDLGILLLSERHPEEMKSGHSVPQEDKSQPLAPSAEIKQNCVLLVEKSLEMQLRPPSKDESIPSKLIMTSQMENEEKPTVLVLLDPKPTYIVDKEQEQEKDLGGTLEEKTIPKLDIQTSQQTASSESSSSVSPLDGSEVTPFVLKDMDEETRDFLEFHVKKKMVQRQCGMPTIVVKSLKLFHFLTSEFYKDLERQSWKPKEKIPHRLIHTERRAPFPPPCKKAKSVCTDPSVQEFPGTRDYYIIHFEEPEETREHLLPYRKRGTKIITPQGIKKKFILFSMEPEELRKLSFHIIVKMIEIKKKAFPDVVEDSFKTFSILSARSLPRLIRLGNKIPRAKHLSLPFVAREALCIIDLNIKHKYLVYKWKLPKVYTMPVQKKPLISSQPSKLEITFGKGEPHRPCTPVIILKKHPEGIATPDVTHAVKTPESPPISSSLSPSPVKKPPKVKFEVLSDKSLPSDVPLEHKMPKDPAVETPPQHVPMDAVSKDSGAQTKKELGTSPEKSVPRETSQPSSKKEETVTDKKGAGTESRAQAEKKETGSGESKKDQETKKEETTSQVPSSSTGKEAAAAGSKEETKKGEVPPSSPGKEAAAAAKDSKDKESKNIQETKKEAVPSQFPSSSTGNEAAAAGKDKDQKSDQEPKKAEEGTGKEAAGKEVAAGKDTGSKEQKSVEKAKKGKVVFMVTPSSKEKETAAVGKDKEQKSEQESKKGEVTSQIPLSSTGKEATASGKDEDKGKQEPKKAEASSTGKETVATGKDKEEKGKQEPKKAEASSTGKETVATGKDKGEKGKQEPKKGEASSTGKEATASGKDKEEKGKQEPKKGEASSTGKETVATGKDKEEKGKQEPKKAEASSTGKETVAAGKDKGEKGKQEPKKGEVPSQVLPSPAGKETVAAAKDKEQKSEQDPKKGEVTSQAPPSSTGQEAAAAGKDTKSEEPKSAQDQSKAKVSFQIPKPSPEKAATDGKESASKETKKADVPSQVPSSSIGKEVVAGENKDSKMSQEAQKSEMLMQLSPSSPTPSMGKETTADWKRSESSKGKMDYQEELKGDLVSRTYLPPHGKGSEVSVTQATSKESREGWGELKGEMGYRVLPPRFGWERETSREQTGIQKSRSDLAELKGELCYQVPGAFGKEAQTDGKPIGRITHGNGPGEVSYQVPYSSLENEAQKHYGQKEPENGLGELRGELYYQVPCSSSEKKAQTDRKLTGRKDSGSGPGELVPCFSFEKDSQADGKPPGRKEFGSHPGELRGELCYQVPQSSFEKEAQTDGKQTRRKESQSGQGELKGKLLYQILPSYTDGKRSQNKLDGRVTGTGGTRSRPRQVEKGSSSKGLVPSFDRNEPNIEKIAEMNGRGVGPQKARTWQKEASIVRTSLFLELDVTKEKLNVHLKKKMETKLRPQQGAELSLDVGFGREAERKATKTSCGNHPGGSHSQKKPRRPFCYVCMPVDDTGKAVKTVCWALPKWILEMNGNRIPQVARFESRPKM